MPSPVGTCWRTSQQRWMPRSTPCFSTNFVLSIKIHKLHPGPPSPWWFLVAYLDWVPVAAFRLTRVAQEWVLGTSLEQLPRQTSSSGLCQWTQVDKAWARPAPSHPPKDLQLTWHSQAPTDLRPKPWGLWISEKDYSWACKEDSVANFTVEYRPLVSSTCIYLWKKFQLLSASLVWKQKVCKTAFIVKERALIAWREKQGKARKVRKKKQGRRNPEYIYLSY